MPAITQIIALTPICQYCFAQLDTTQPWQGESESDDAYWRRKLAVQEVTCSGCHRTQDMVAYQRVTIDVEE